MSQNIPTILLHGDADAIKEYVFETSFLPQIRGGSQLLVECEEEVKKQLHAFGGSEIYCSGGSFLFALPSDQAEAARRAVERIYLEKTGAATVTVVYEQNLPPDPPDSPPTGSWAQRLWQAYWVQDGDNKTPPTPFARRVAFLAGQLRETKSQKGQSPFWEAPPFGLRCDLCGKRVAARIWHSPEGEEKRLCPVCWTRYEAGRGGGQFNDRFQEWAEHQSLILSADRPRDLDHLVQSARGHQYLAFLYADGNDIGGLLQHVSDEKELQSLSKILRGAAEEALFEALGKVCGQALSGAGYWPFEIVHIGGDDVSLLIQAGYAWEVAVEFLERFEQKVNQGLRNKLEKLAGWRITASAGITVADPKYPIRYLEKLAEDVLKKAKKRAKENPHIPCSAVNFLWLPNPVAAESADPLLAYYEPRKDVALTNRPYTLEQARSLVALAEQATKMPSSLRHRWAEALEKGLFVSLNSVYYDIGRRKAEERQAFQGFLQDLGTLTSVQSTEEPPAPLWKYDISAGKWRTALLDVLELAELRATRPDVEEAPEEVAE
jgi:GGDEF domain-containing protein